METAAQFTLLLWLPITVLGSWSNASIVLVIQTHNSLSFIQQARLECPYEKNIDNEALLYALHKEMTHLHVHIRIKSKPPLVAFAYRTHNCVDNLNCQKDGLYMQLSLQKCVTYNFFLIACQVKWLSDRCWLLHNISGCSQGSKYQQSICSVI